MIDLKGVSKAYSKGQPALNNAVSYTHLDVYKRQPYRLPGQECFSGSSPADRRGLPPEYCPLPGAASQMCIRDSCRIMGTHSHILQLQSWLP